MDEIPEENVSQSWSQLPYLNPVWRPTVQVQLLHPGLGSWQLPTPSTAQVVPAASQHWKGEGVLRLSPSAEYLAGAASYTLFRSHLDTGFERWADPPLSLGTLRESPHELQEKSRRKGLGVNICDAERKAAVQAGSL